MRHKPRDSIRINVPSELQVTLQIQTTDGRIWPARCLDLSLSGIMVEFPPHNIPTIPTNDKVKITVKYATGIANIPGMALHRKERRMGFSLPDGPGDRKISDDQSLWRIFRNLERIILRKQQT